MGDDSKDKSPASTTTNRVPSVRNMTLERNREIKYMFRKHLPTLIKKRADQIEKNAKYAHLCVLDAFQGRLGNGLATNSKKSPFIYKIFYIQTHEYLLNTVVISCALHTLSVFFEPDKGCSASYLMYLFHLIVSLIHITDCALKMYYEGFWEYWDHDWQQIYLVTISLNFIDLMWCGCTYYTNPLRPVVGLLRARSGRRFFTIVKRMLPGLTETLTPMFVFLVMLVVICGLIFDNRMEELSDLRFASYNWFWMIYTNDTYDNLLPTSLVTDGAYVAFFFISIYLGQKFLLSLILGSTFDTFRDFTKKQLKDERIKQLRGLVKAFAALDDQGPLQKNGKPGGTGIISEAVFYSVLSECIPKATPEEKALYFELVAGGGTADGVNILQFLNLRDVLNYNFVRLRDSMAMQISEGFKEKFESYANTIVLPTPLISIAASNAVLGYFDKYNVRDWVNYLDISCVGFGLFDFMLFSWFGITVCTAITLYYMAEFYLTLVVKEGKLYSVLKDAHLFSWEFMIGVVGTVLIHLARFLRMSHNFDGSAFGFLLIVILSAKFKLAARFLRCMRITRMNKDLSTFINAMIDVMPLFCQSMTFALIVTYIFAMLGNLLFGAVIEKWDSPLKAFVVMNMLFLPASFVDVMEEAMEEVHPLTCVFFSCYFILSLLVGNLSLSVIIEWYGENVNDQSNEARDAVAEAEATQFKNIVNRAMVRKSLSGKKGAVSFHDIRFSKRGSTDHRVKLVGGATVDLDALKKAKKESNIDLVAFYNEVYRHQRDVGAELEFIRAAKEYVSVVKFPFGAEIFVAQSPASHVYLVIEGDVVLQSDDTPDCPVQLQAVAAVGYEALQPKGTYTMTCLADSAEVSCLVFTQDNVVMDMSPELSGYLMRLVHKSSAQYDVLFAEKLKRVSQGFHSRKFSTSFGN